MVIITVDEEVRRQLVSANISKGMLDTCLNSKFLTVRYDGDGIIGICCISGILNTMGTEVAEGYRGRGLSHELLSEMLYECKRRGMSFLTGVFKTTNTSSIRTHTRIGYVPVCTVHYSPEEGKEIITILPINRKGSRLLRILAVLDTRVGNSVLGLTIWCVRPLLKSLLGFSSGVMPRIDLSYCMRNFEKVKDTIKIHNLGVHIHNHG